MQYGGQVMGFIPKLLLGWEVQHRGITELIVCDDMHERKKEFTAFVQPWYYRRLWYWDELFEIVTWNQLTIHDKHIYILNSVAFTITSLRILNG